MHYPGEDTVIAKGWRKLITRRLPVEICRVFLRSQSVLLEVSARRFSDAINRDDFTFHFYLLTDNYAQKITVKNRTLIPAGGLHRTEICH
jgi:hypothetical protein